MLVFVTCSIFHQTFRVQTFSRVQILQQFSSRCQELAANDNRGFKQEFEELNDIGKDLPSRREEQIPLHITLRPLPGEALGPELPPTLRLHQCKFCARWRIGERLHLHPGASSGHVADFWRMVWEQNVRVIVMVTALRHKDAVLCEKYWPPEGATVCYGLIQVTTMRCKKGPDYFITSINLRQRDSPTSRTITQYYYPSWPDRGVPREPSSLCAFSEHVRQDLEGSPRLGPAVVHCSAGVGRSGTFVTLLWLMQLCVRGIRPNVRAAVEDLRLHRMWMVQNLDQYIFVHQCLLHWLVWRTAAGWENQ
uniref:protein-tyrosine-phosphatase n=1 Tax=Tetraodon nigroviridis TaxID=99883 RepID=H3DKM5_TETNG